MPGPLVSLQDLRKALDDPPGLGFAIPLVGMGGGVGINAVANANQGYWVRLATGATITKIGYVVGVQSGNISLAAYSNSGIGRAAVPGARLATTGSIACTAPGEQESALGSTVTVHRGDWLHLSCDNTTATFGGVVSGGQYNYWTALAFTATTSFPAPAAPASLVATTSRLPLLIGIP